jgi:uncharacterized protein (DUF2236 family)
LDPLSNHRSRNYYFAPGTVFWKVNSEAVVSLAGARALMLELAHPLVAEGVAHHSDFRGDPFGRLFRTMQTMATIMFTEAESAARAIRHFNGCHTKVKGKLGEAVGPYSSGAHYHAADPLLKLWVLATLYDSCLLAYDQFVRPLSLEDRENYYRDGLVLGELLGIPRALMPPTYGDFANYVETMIHSEVLTVGESARQVATALFAPPLFGPFARLGSFVGIGLLPERIRNEFGFEWDEGQERWLKRIAAWHRRARPFVPDVLLVNPQATLTAWRQRNQRIGNG